MGEALATMLLGMVNQFDWEIDVVAPVPLSAGRLKERGYNQAALLAFPLALALGIPYKRRSLKRIKETRTQVGLDVRQRWENVKGAFWGDPLIVRDRRILLVDDVATSGATLNACALALKGAGARSVYALTLARASRQHPT